MTHDDPLLELLVSHFEIEQVLEDNEIPVEIVYRYLLEEELIDVEELRRLYEAN